MSPMQTFRGKLMQRSWNALIWWGGDFFPSEMDTKVIKIKGRKAVVICVNQENCSPFLSKDDIKLNEVI